MKQIIKIEERRDNVTYPGLFVKICLNFVFKSSCRNNESMNRRFSAAKILKAFCEIMEFSFRRATSNNELIFLTKLVLENIKHTTYSFI